MGLIVRYAHAHSALHSLDQPWLNPFVALTSLETNDWQLRFNAFSISTQNQSVNAIFCWIYWSTWIICLFCDAFWFAFLWEANNRNERMLESVNSNTIPKNFASFVQVVMCSHWKHSKVFKRRTNVQESVDYLLSFKKVFS